MKKTLVLFSLLLSSVAVNAQFKLDAADFAVKFKSVFEMAKKRFVTEKNGEVKTIAENGFVSTQGAKTTFNGAEYSRLVVDGDGVLGFDTRWKIGTSKDEAVKNLAEFHKLVKANLPVKFLTRETWEDHWLDGTMIAVEYDSEQFAYQAKQPSAKLGIRLKDGTYYIDLVIFEPIFK